MPNFSNIVERSSIELVHTTPGQLSRLLQHFGISIHYPICKELTTPTDFFGLISIRQEKKESLRTFMSRFNKAALEIRDLNPVVALHHLTTALKPRPFANSICKKPPTDMDDLRWCADKYMQMEELAEFRNQVRAEVAAKVAKLAESSFRSRPKDLALASEVLTVPKRASTPRSNTTKSCKYHRNRGHSTEECAALRDKIEDLIKQGQLQRFVNRPRSPGYHDRRHRRDQPDQDRSDRCSYRERSRSRGRKEDEPTTQPQRVINTIAGGFAGGGSTSSAQKRHLSAVRAVHVIERTQKRLSAITFTEADFKGIVPDQDDPMVISVEIHNCIVWKTLVDQGSSADILYWNTFKQLGILEAELVPYNEPLVGFSGERVQTKGYIKLSTRFCFDGAETRSISVKYVVVHANTSYNILLGRPSLNKLGAIVSTPHLAMKFPSESG
ncbi:uncharacterized protein LOC109810754 [Cajanus cajan]|uniref:uncharacterized protein LOC109810754 n=1 Tax=Cajanus cajan TaxID=3821 RepID=UPI00098DB8F1|nr:uncharacterized protein LOC109810754 [Cajanus cajan]